MSAIIPLMKTVSLILSFTRRAALCIFALFITLGAAGCHAQYAPQEGGIAFQSLPLNPLIDAIGGSTGSPFSHGGIRHRAGTDWKVIEAIGPVRETNLPAWEKQSRDGHLTIT